MESKKISLKDTKQFEGGDFNGRIYFSEKPGLELCEVTIDGPHPEKIVEIETRIYRIIEGVGTFILDKTSYEAEPGDVFVIKKGSTYSYSGKMKLLEINVTK